MDIPLRFRGSRLVASTSAGRGAVLLLAFAFVTSSVGCGDDTDPEGTGGAATSASTTSSTTTAGATGGATTSNVTTGGATTGGATTASSTSASTGTGLPTACEQYCSVSAGCPDANANCLVQCENGTSGVCEATWNWYTTCLAEHFDGQSCLWDFHACESEAMGVMACEDIDFGLTQCDATADGCDCTHAVIGSDFGWSCVEGPNGFECDCTHDGVPTGSCTETGFGACATDSLQIQCCLML